MVEVGNWIVQGVLRKSPSEEWDEGLAPSTQQVNSRVIQHLQVAPSAIFFRTRATLGSLDAELAFIPTQSIDAWVKEVTNPTTHFAAVRKYRDYRAQMHDRVRQLTTEKKERDAARYDTGVNRTFHEVGSLVMVYQKMTAKLEPRWRGTFRIVGLGGTRGVSWQISQLGGRGLRGTYHGDHLRPFRPRQGYLFNGELPLLESQTVRKPKERKRGNKLRGTS